MQIYSVDKDAVINSCFLTCKTNYKYALKYIIPLMQKLNMQRKIQNPKFYTRLGNDIINGCIMPPLTLAFIDNSINIDDLPNNIFFKKYIKDNIQNGFVLDGIQRLNTLLRVSKQCNFNPLLPIFFNILICPSQDKLLYRMITLNNGQKPMTARHQIEVLLENIYNFDNDNISIISEKDAVGSLARGSFKKSSFINAYSAFLSGTTNIDNKKIIESKLDELLAIKIIENGANNTKVEYTDVINLIAKYSQRDNVKKWFQNENNLIGFSVAMRNLHIFKLIKSFDIDEFNDLILLFERIFSNADVSQVRVGSLRRKLVYQFLIDLKRLRLDELEPVEALSILLEKFD